MEHALDHERVVKLHFRVCLVARRCPLGFKKHPKFRSEANGSGHAFSARTCTMTRVTGATAVLSCAEFAQNFIDKSRSDLRLTSTR